MGRDLSARDAGWFTVADATRAALAISACHADFTRAIYTGAWQR